MREKTYTDVVLQLHTAEYYNDEYSQKLKCIELDDYSLYDRVASYVVAYQIKPNGGVWAILNRMQEQLELAHISESTVYAAIDAMFNTSSAIELAAHLGQLCMESKHFIDEQGETVAAADAIETVD